MIVIIIFIIILFRSVPEIGIEMEMYKVNENESLLEVCLVTVASIPIEDCANQKFELSSTAGKYLSNHICNDKDHFE